MWWLSTRIIGQGPGCMDVAGVSDGVAMARAANCKGVARV